MIDPALREDPYALQKHLGFEITDWQQGYARVEMPIREVHGNRYGIPHGGVHATLIDTAMGFSGCYTGDPDNPQMAMTLSLTVNYLGQAKGERLIVEARKTGGGRKVFFTEALLSDEHGNPVASGVGTFRYRTGTKAPEESPK